MLENCKKYWIAILALVLGATAGILIYVDFSMSGNMLTVAMLNIGQGDSILIRTASGHEVLFDGGPRGAILRELPKVIPFYDHHIDMIVITNPDADHIGGFLDVLKAYKVDKVLEPGTFNDTKTYKDLEREIVNRKIEKFLARRGMRIDLGSGAYIDILFPDRDVSTWTSNDGSIVAQLHYGKTSVMLTGDATQKTEKIILAENSAQSLRSDILKVGHHGSRTSTSSEFVKALAPTYALISVGKDNKYGHPHKETLDTLTLANIKTLRTDLLGTIIMKTDGQNEVFSYEK